MPIQQRVFDPEFPQGIFNLNKPTPDEEKLQQTFTPYNHEFFRRRIAEALIMRSRLSPIENSTEEFALNSAVIEVFQELLSLASNQPNLTEE